MAPRPDSERGPSRRRPVAVLLALAAAAGLGIAIFLAASGRLGGTGRADPLHLDPPELAIESLALDEGVPVLCYHYFRRSLDPLYLARVLGAVVLNLPTLGPKEFWTTPVGQFERHLRWFRDNGVRVMTLDEVAAAGAAGDLPRRAVVLTIDDADLSVYELAWPLLERYDARAHLFVPTARIGRSWSGLQLCSWDQLRRMSDSGRMVIDSHTHDLHWKLPTDGGWQPAFYFPEQIAAARARAGSGAEAAAGALGNLAAAAFALAAPDDSLRPPGADTPGLRLARGRYRPVAEDLRRSWHEIAEGVGRRPRYLAWPYGFASTPLDSVAAAAGFAGTVSLKPYPYDGQVAPWHIGRFAVTAKTTVADLEALFDRRR